MVFGFPTSFVEEADTIRITKVQAFVALPQFLMETASQRFRASKNSSRPAAVDSLPKAVHYIIGTYATPGKLRETFDQLHNLEQGVSETETEFAPRNNQAPYPCANGPESVDKKTHFVNGLLPEVLLHVMQFGVDQPRYKLTFERRVQFTGDEGLPASAQTSSARTVEVNMAHIALPAVAKPIPIAAREVPFREPQYSAPTSL